MLQTKLDTDKANMRDEKKLSLTSQQKQDLLILQHQLDRSQEKCQGYLWKILHSSAPRYVTNNLELLQFQELSKSSVDRSTDGGIVDDDRQKLLRFKTAIRLVTKNTQGEEQELSDQLESFLSTIISLMTKVLEDNIISPSPPAGLSDLRTRLDTSTRQFLDVFGESGKENSEDGTDSNLSAETSLLHDVRNYVIVRDLGDALLLLKRDLAHVMGGIETFAINDGERCEITMESSVLRENCLTFCKGASNVTLGEVKVLHHELSMDKEFGMTAQ